VWAKLRVVPLAAVLGETQVLVEAACGSSAVQPGEVAAVAVDVL